MRRLALTSLLGLLALAAVPAGVQAGRATPPWLQVNLIRPAASALKDADLIPAADRLQALRKAGRTHTDVIRRIKIALEASGQVSEQATTVRYFVSDEGVRQFGNLEASVRTASAKLTIEEAWVRLPDGSRLPFNPATLQVRSDDEDDIFSDQQAVVLPFSGLVAGAAVVLVTRQTFDQRRWPLPWSRIVVTEGFTSADLLEVDVGWHPTRKPDWRTDDPQLACTTPSETRLLCQRRFINGLHGDPEVRNWLDQLPHLVVATPATWQQLARQTARLFAPNARPDEKVRALAARLAPAQGLWPQQRFALLNRFVAEEIRYVGFEHGEGAVIPRPAATTLQRRYGDCKDKVALLMSLANASQLPAFPVLVATDHRQLTKLLLPSSQYFNHLIACEWDDQGLRCSDPTSPVVPAGTLPMGVAGTVGLALVDAEDEIMVLPNDPHAWDLEVHVQNTTACDGSIQEVMSRAYRGQGAGVMRQLLRQKSEDERRRWLEEGYAELMGDKVKPTFDVQMLENPTAELIINSTTRFPGGTPLKPGGFSEPDIWLRQYGKQFRTSNRHHPYDHAGLRIKSTVSYQGCPKLRVNLVGPELVFEDRYGSLWRRYNQVAPDRVDVETRLVLPSLIVPSAELDRFNKFLDTTLAETSIWFSFEEASTPPVRRSTERGR